MRTREPGFSGDLGGWQPRPISGVLDDDVAAPSAVMSGAPAPTAGEPALASAAPGLPSPYLPVGAPSPRPSQAEGGPDGQQIQSEVSQYLDFLSQVCAELGVPDPVQEYFAPVVGRWSDLHAEADRWRAVGAVGELVAQNLTEPLAGLDAAWQGADADSFIDYVTRVGLAGHDMADAMIAMGEVLDLTADGIRKIVTDMADVLVEMAEVTSQALSGAVSGEERTRQYLEQMKHPTRELFEATRQVLDGLVKLCEGIDGSQVFDKITMAHQFPTENWSMAPDVPPVDVGAPGPGTVSPAAAADLSGLGGGGSGFGGGGGGFGGGGLGGGAGGAAVSASPLSGGAATGIGEAAPGKPGGMPVGGAPAGGSDGGGGRGGMMGGGMPMGGGMAGGQGGGNEHKAKTKVAGNAEDIFGKPAKASPAVIGDD